MGVKLRVLLIEDSESDAGYIIGQLQMAGYVVESDRVVNQDEMKAALVKHTWDIIFSDYKLTGFDSAAAACG